MSNIVPAGLGSPTRLLMLVAIAVIGLAVAKFLAKQINRPDYLFI